MPDDVACLIGIEGGHCIHDSFAPVFVSDETRHYDAELEAAQVRFASLHIGSPSDAADALAAWTAANPTPRATVDQVADHIDYIRGRVGIDHIGIGGDYDGIESTPQGLEDVSCCPRLFLKLLTRGYTDDDFGKIAGLNILRVLREADAVAQHIRKVRVASDQLLDESSGPAS